ncbi:MAG: hypothetical protein WA825_09240 [Steroidobacteraceae bacterium]
MFIAHQLDSRDNNVQAVIWPMGFISAVRIEHAIGAIKPVINCLLVIPALYLAAHFLIGRLIWYGVPPLLLGLSDDARGLLRLVVGIGLLVLVGWVAPGHVRRRIFVASVFPLLGLISLFGAAWGMNLQSGAGPAGHIGLMLCGAIGFGLAMSALLALPAMILYRDAAMPVIILAIVPAVARANWMANSDIHHSESLTRICWDACPFICSAIGIVTVVVTCRHWQRRAVLSLPPRGT